MFNPEKLEIKRTLLASEYPLLFLCEGDKKYLGTHVHDNGLVFIYVEVTDQQFKDVDEKWPEYDTKKIFLNSDAIYLVHVKEDDYIIEEKPGEYFWRYIF